MPIVRYIAVAAAPLAALLSGFAPLASPGAVVPAILIAAVLLAACFAAVIGKELRRIEHWLLLVLPLIFWSSATLAVLLAEHAGFRNLAAATTVFVIGFTIWIVFQYFHLPLRYQPYSLASISQVMGIMTFFYVGFDLAALVTFLSVPLPRAVLMSFGIGGFLAAHHFWTAKVPSKRSLAMIAATAVIASETFWVAALLPVSAAVSGALLALTGYVATGLARHVYHNTVTRSVTLRYSLITLAGLVFVLGTAQWV